MKQSTATLAKHAEPKVWVRMELQDVACRRTIGRLRNGAFGTEHLDGSFAANLLIELRKHEPDRWAGHRIVPSSEGSAC